MRKRKRISPALLAWALLPIGLPAQPPQGTAIQDHYRRAQEARQAGQNDVAVKEFQEILRLDPKNAEAHANLGVIAYSQKDYSLAVNEFHAALDLRPAMWNAQAFLGMCELRLGQPEQARPLLEGSFTHLTDGTLKSEAGMDLIAIYGERQEYTRALEVVQALERTHPNDPNLLYTAYRTYTELAAKTLAKLAQVAPDSAQVHRILAQAQQSQDDFTGAIAQYRKALEIDPKLPGLHFELGQAILAKSTDEPSRQEAEKEFRLALADNPADAYSQYMLGEIAWLRSQPDRALDYYMEAVRLAPDWVDARIALGKTLTAVGRPSDALDQLTQAVREDPQSDIAHYRLAQAYRKLGRRDDAERELATFRKLRDSQAAREALSQPVQERTVPHQTVAPDEPQ